MTMLGDLNFRYCIILVPHSQSVEAAEGIGNSDTPLTPLSESKK